MDIYNSWLVKMPVAHRGYHNTKFPENSLGAFGNAIENNYAIELDVRMTDDGEVIVFHDEALSRMTGKDGYIPNMKYEDMSELRLAKTDEKIPLFSEVLEFVNGRTPILIEIKNSGKIGPLEQKVIDLLADYKGDIAVQSFNPYSVEYFKKNAKHYLRGLLSCDFKGSDLPRMRRFALKRLMLFSTAGADFIAYRFDNLPNRYVSKHNVPVLAWTVGSIAEYDAVKKYCHNVIFENFPADPVVNE